MNFGRYVNSSVTSPGEAYYSIYPAIIIAGHQQAIYKTLLFQPNPNKRYNIKFWFGTGGAGICISRGLALKMLPIAR